MFEEYLEDSNYFSVKASQVVNEREAKRDYRVSVFCAISAVEAFINYVGDVFAQGDTLQPYEIAFLTDRKFEVSGGRFQILEQAEYHRLEDKLKFLICNFVPDFDFEHTPCWSHLIEFKRFRDSITHPRQDEDEVDVAEYKDRVETGLTAAIDIMNHLCMGIFRRPLRQRLVDLIP